MGLIIKDNVAPMLRGLRKKIEGEMEKAVRQSAYLFQRNWIKGIRKQKYKSQWKALSPKYAKRKTRHGRSSPDLILIDSGEMSRSIEVQRLAGGAYAVGTNHVAARAHEFGFTDRNLPARPSMQPALEDSFDEIGDVWKERFVAAFGSAL